MNRPLQMASLFEFLMDGWTVIMGWKFITQRREERGAEEAGRMGFLLVTRQSRKVTN